jgi:hypothetical protein
VDGASLRAALRRVDQGVLTALGIPHGTVGPEVARQMLQGKPLAGLIDAATWSPAPPGGPALPYAGVVDEVGNLVAIIQRNEENQRWSYGYVYARS